MMTLDDAQDTFRSMPSTESAAEYLSAALTYLEDGMIGKATAVAALKEVRDWLKEAIEKGEIQ